jgi:hypothetical protein
MKYLGLVLSFLLVFGAANGFCQELSLEVIKEEMKGVIKEAVREELEDFSRQGSVQTRFISFTGTIANELNDAQIKNLSFYLPPGDLRLMPKSQYTEKNGIVTTIEGKGAEVIVSAKNKGKLKTSGKEIDGEKYYVVSFPLDKADIELKFVYNRQNDYFELKSSDYSFAGSVYLFVQEEVKNSSPAIPNISIEVQRNQTTMLTQNGQLREDDIVAFIYSRNPAMSRGNIKAIVSTYIQIAMSENINHDIAIAQMCYATNFLTTQQRLVTHNYAGLLDVNSVSARFNDMATGIRAHIQHLKGYASKETPKGIIVDSRYDVLRRMGILGTITTLEGLYAQWAPQSYDYGVKINSILRDLNYFSMVAWWR